VNSTTQNDVIGFLSSSAAFNDGTKEVQVITTHGAKVFLGKTDVYKIKRDIKYDYMDFSTLEKRHKACKREIEINKPAAPSIYLDVVPITRDKQGHISFSGEGEVMEWAVHMRRFPEQDVLKNLAQNNALTLEISSQLGRQIALRHKGLISVRDFQKTKRTAEIIKGLEDGFCDPALASLRRTSSTFIKQAYKSLDINAAELETRREQGFVRRCHGDLHLQNIVMLDGTPTAFDALEFDERMATTDVLYDLAFLIMDMLHMDLKAQANRVMNRYALVSWELVKEHGFSVLPLFLALRAAIRSLVTSQLATSTSSAGEAEWSETKQYLEQAIGFLKPSKPELMAVGGFSGTGKSTLASGLAVEKGNIFGSLLIRSDLERKQMFGFSEFEHLPPEAYATDISEQVYKLMFEKAETALEQKQPVILDAVFAEQDEKLRVSELAEKLGVPFYGFWLTAPEETLIKRVTLRKNDASDADISVLKKQILKYHDHSLSKGWHELDASGSQKKTLEKAKNHLAGHRTD